MCPSWTVKLQKDGKRFLMPVTSEWVCSPNGRGASGDNGDYALEMDNFNGDEAAEDWLVTPRDQYFQFQ